MIDDTAAYLAKYPDHRHAQVPWSDTETCQLVRVWRALLESQNGEGVDGTGLETDDRIRVLLQHFTGPEGAPVLVLGCGRGQEVDFIRRQGYAVTGVTLGPMNVAIAKKTFKFDALFQDAHCLRMPASSFDLVIAAHVFEHSPSPLLLLFECARVLKPHGTVIIETPSPKYSSGGRSLHHVLCPTPRQFRDLLTKSGFFNIKQWLDDVVVTEDTLDSSVFLKLVTCAQRMNAQQLQMCDPTTRALLQ